MILENRNFSAVRRQRQAQIELFAGLLRLLPEAECVGRNAAKSDRPVVDLGRRSGHHQIPAVELDVAGERILSRGGSRDRNDVEIVFNSGGQFGTVLRRQDAALRRHQPPGGIDVKCDHISSNMYE